ncbi:uncharacterized protein TA10530 [Theileria annulata]|uniref:Uncharacterized protein n=1 Tax=Theileria annulata TaxID=5874 RepID=Q4U8F0_THEAN|nr:uncharacterized protein TA10530 [Theileria annulata]CAI76903.1 hypothetical protein TA10530 [Theileria annulata]|eukprot:XP_953528.1 hypothetical protein TA10530 [Theileria annulata]
MTGEQSLYNLEQENQNKNHRFKIQSIVGFLTVVIFLTTNQLNVYSRYFSALFRISQVNAQIFISKLYTFRTFLIILGCLSKFIIFKIPVDNSFLSLISLFLIVVCRLIFLLLLYFTQNLAINVYFLLLFEAFLFGFFYTTFISNVFGHILIIIIFLDLASSFVFFTQLFLSLFLENNPLLIIKLQSWLSLILSIVGFFLWYYFLNKFHKPYFNDTQQNVDNINNHIRRLGIFSQSTNEFSTKINDEIENLKGISTIKQKIASFLNEFKIFVRELWETKYSHVKESNNKSSLDKKRSDYLLNSIKKLVLLDDLISTIEKLISSGKSKILEFLSAREILYVKINSEFRALRAIRFKNSYSEEIESVINSGNDHSSSLYNTSAVISDISAILEELNILGKIKKLHKIHDELKSLSEQITSFKDNMNSINDYKFSIKKAKSKLSKLLRILSSILETVMEEDVYEFYFLEQSFGDKRKLLVEIELEFKAMFDDYLSRIQLIETKGTSEILKSLDLVYDSEFKSVMTSIVKLNDLVKGIQEIKEELITLFEKIQKFKFNLPINSYALFEQWNKDPESRNLLLESEYRYYQIKDFHNFYLSLNHAKVLDLVENFEQTAEKLNESLTECSTVISDKITTIEQLINDYEPSKNVLEELKIDETADKITLDEHKNKLSSLIKEIISALETENVEVEDVLKDLVEKSSNEVDIILKKLDLLVTSKNEESIKKLKVLKLLEFPDVKIQIEKESGFFVLSPLFLYYSIIFGLSSFFFEFLFPRFIPYGLLEHDISGRVNLILHPFKVSGSIIMFVIYYFNRDFVNWTSNFNSYWTLIVPQFLVFLWSMLAIHTRVRMFTFIRNSIYSVNIMGLILVILNSFTEAVSLVGLGYELFLMGESSKLLEIHFILSLLMRYFYSRLSIGYNNARINMGLIPPRFIPNIILANPVWYWIRETIWRSYRNVFTDLSTNLADILNNP